MREPMALRGAPLYGTGARNAVGVLSEPPLGYSRYAAFVVMVRPPNSRIWTTGPSIGGCVLRGSGAFLPSAKWVRQR